MALAFQLARELTVRRLYADILSPSPCHLLSAHAVPSPVHSRTPTPKMPPAPCPTPPRPRTPTNSLITCRQQRFRDPWRLGPLAARVSSPRSPLPTTTPQDFNLFFVRIAKVNSGELITMPLSKLVTNKFSNLSRWVRAWGGVGAWGRGAHGARLSCPWDSHTGLAQLPYMVVGYQHGV